MTLSLTLGIDVGGTSIKAAAIDAEGGTHAERRVPTPSGDSSGEATTTIVTRLVDEFSRSHQVTSLGLVVPGIVDETSGLVVSAVNLGWTNLAMHDMVGRAVPLPVAFGHDVRAGAYAEATKGAAREVDGVSAFIPIGTGIAAGIIVSGTPLTSGGWAGEIGQIEVAATTQRAGLRTLESVASASAIARRIGCADAKEAVALVRAGDEQAIRVWDDAISAIAEAIAWTTAVIGAETIVIGGGLCHAGATLLDPLRAALAIRLGALRHPELVTATFGDRAALVGAGLLAHRVRRP